MIDLQVHAGVARLTLAHPPVNALSPALLRAIRQSLDELQDREDWQVLVVASTARVFCAGGELEVMRDWMEGPNGGERVGHYSHEVQQLFRRIQQLPQVTLAACAGTAVGGGFELALACDLRAAAERAKFGLPEVSLNLLPAAGGTQRLARLCGYGTAARMIYTAEIVSARQALAHGLVQWVFADAEFDAGVQALAERIASLPREALLLAKECVGLALTSPGDEGYAHEITGASRVGASAVTRQRVAEFFAGRRP